jgi:predicted transcriptional regulator
MASLGDLELRVMEAVWALGEGTVREVSAALEAGDARAYTTVMTTLDRLFRKGLLAREKEGLAWRYRAAVARRDWERQVADALAAELVARGEAGVAAFVDAAVDPELLERLEAMIRARRSRPPSDGGAP